VVGVYDGVVNVLSAKGDFLTLTSRLSALSPCAMLLDDADILAVPGVGSEVSADPGRGCVLFSERGNVVCEISQRRAARWSGRIRRRAASAFYEKIRRGGRASLRTLLAARGSPEGLLGLATDTPDSPPARFARKLVGVRSRGGETLDLVLGGLVGLGPGLTPSGDDFLAGYLLAKILTEGKLPRAAAASIRSRLSSTSPAGKALLSGALDRRFPHYLHEFVETWAAAKEAEGESAAVAKALSHGSTSGTDALAGLLFGLD